jgi:hypothetical protein
MGINKKSEMAFDILKILISKLGSGHPNDYMIDKNNMQMNKTVAESLVESSFIYADEFIKQYCNEQLT